MENIFKIAEKWLKNETLMVKKAGIMLMTSSKQLKRLFSNSNPFVQKQHEW